MTFAAALPDPAAREALRIAVALVFAAAAIGKFRDRPAFRGILAGYRLLPALLTGPVAQALPALEAVVALLLPWHLLQPWPRLAAICLLLLFAAAMAINLFRGRADIACGCAFATGKRTGLRWPAVGINLALAASLLCAPAGPPLDVPQAATALLAGIAIFLLIQAGNALLALGPIAQHTAHARFK